MIFLKAKDFLKKLICWKNQRINVEEALKHEFITGTPALTKFINDVTEKDESAQRHMDSLNHNISEFNKYGFLCFVSLFFYSRKISMEEKNLLAMSPTHSPILNFYNQSPSENENEISIIVRSPTLNGFTRTCKSINIKGSFEKY